MTLLSASDDFQLRTLAVFQGPLEKLAYLARLRNASGEYCHWGMSRIYGEQAAAAALAEVHSQVWFEILRTPIPTLSSQLQEMDAATRRALLEELGVYRGKIIPTELRGGPVRHFNSVLLALECLYRSADATRQVA